MASELRTATKGWSKHGSSKDHGAASGAKGILSDLNESQVDAVKTLYKVVVNLVKGKPGEIQRAACLAAASDYSLVHIIEQAKKKPAGVNVLKVDVEAVKLAKAEVGNKPMTIAQFAVVFDRHKVAVKAARKAKVAARKPRAATAG